MLLTSTFDRLSHTVSGFHRKSNPVPPGGVREPDSLHLSPPDVRTSLCRPSSPRLTPLSQSWARVVAGPAGPLPAGMLGPGVACLSLRPHLTGRPVLQAVLSALPGGELRSFP